LDEAFALIPVACIGEAITAVLAEAAIRVLQICLAIIVIIHAVRAHFNRALVLYAIFVRILGVGIIAVAGVASVSRASCSIALRIVYVVSIPALLLRVWVSWTSAPARVNKFVVENSIVYKGAVAACIAPDVELVVPADDVALHNAGFAIFAAIHFAVSAREAVRAVDIIVGGASNIPWTVARGAPLRNVIRPSCAVAPR
jgi:hypothetical protein